MKNSRNHLLNKLPLKRQTVRSLERTGLDTILGGLPVGTGGGITPQCQPTNPSERAVQATCA